MCAHLIPTLCESFIHSLIQIQADMTKILPQCQPTKSITNYYAYSFMICISGGIRKRPAQVWINSWTHDSNFNATEF